MIVRNTMKQKNIGLEINEEKTKCYITETLADREDFTVFEKAQSFEYLGL